MKLLNLKPGLINDIIIIKIIFRQETQLKDYLKCEKDDFLFWLTLENRYWFYSKVIDAAVLYSFAKLHEGGAPLLEEIDMAALNDLSKMEKFTIMQHVPDHANPIIRNAFIIIIFHINKKIIHSALFYIFR